LVSVASVERKLNHFAIGDHGAHLRVRGFHHGSLGLRRHYLCQRAELQAHIDQHDAADLNVNAFLAVLLESLRLYHHRITAYGK